MKPRAIIYIDIPLIEARSPTAPQPVSAIMLYRTAERTTLGKRRFYYAGTPPRYVQLVTQEFVVRDITGKTYYSASVSQVVASTSVGLPTYQTHGYTKITLHQSLGTSIKGAFKHLSEIVQSTSDDTLVSPIKKAVESSTSRFDPNFIAADTLGRLLEHYSRAATLFRWPTLRFITDDVARGLMQPEIELLCRIANGEVDRSTASKRLVAQVEDTIERMIGLLCERPLTLTASLGAPVVPKEFWRTYIGQVMCACQKWLHGSHWIGYQQATKMLYGQASRKAFNRINRLVDEGKLTRYEDPDEPNPRRAGRLDRREVAQFLRRE
jgi:hypothetical protein